ILYISCVESSIPTSDININEFSAFSRGSSGSLYLITLSGLGILNISKFVQTVFPARLALYPNSASFNVFPQPGKAVTIEIVILQHAPLISFLFQLPGDQLAAAS